MKRAMKRIPIPSFEEIWADVTNITLNGVEPNRYIVSNYSKVYDKKKGIFLIPYTLYNGYNSVRLNTIYGSKSIFVHRLVMLTFNYVPGCENLQVDHVDTFKTHNIVNNLEWVTNEENMKRAILNGLIPKGEDNSNAKLTNSQVYTICECLRDGVPIEEIINKIGYVDSKNIKTLIFIIFRREAWNHISNEFVFDEEAYNRFMFTAEQTHVICRCLEKNIKYEDILRELGYDVDNMSKHDIKRHGGIFSNIKRKKYYTEISSQYNIDPKRNSMQTLTEEQVRKICEYLEKGYQVVYILGLMDMECNKYNKKTIYHIKYRDCYKDISKDYNF